MKRAVIAAVVIIDLAAPAAQAARKPATMGWEQLPAWVRTVAGSNAKAAVDGGDLVWLHDAFRVQPLAEGGVRMTRRRVGRVLRPRGVDDAAYCSVAYRGEDVVESIQAWVVQEDRSLRAASEKDATDQPYMADAAGFEDSRLRWLRAPGVTPDSIVACETVVLQHLDTGAARFFFGSASRPTVESRFELELPEGWRFELTPVRAERVHCDDSGRGARCTAGDLRPLPPQSWRPPADRLLPLVWARWWSEDGSRGYTDWNAVGRWYEQLAGPVLDEPGEAARIGAALRPVEAGELLGALQEAYDFAAREVRYVSIQVGIGGFKPFTPARVCDLRYGDCKAKAYLIRAIVDQWEQVSFPVLIRTRDLGAVRPEVPSPAQFNHCIAAVKLPDGVGDRLWSVQQVEGIGRVVFLDATVRHGSPWDLSPAVQGTLGLLVHANGGVLVQIPEQPAESASRRVALQARIDDQGRLVEGSLSRRWTGNEATAARYRLAGLRDDQRRSEALRSIQDRLPGARLADYDLQGFGDVYGPLEESLELAGARLGRRVDQLLIVEAGASLPWGDLPERWEWPLWLGPPRQDLVAVSLDVPDGWGPEEIPGALSIDGPDLIATAGWKQERGRLSYERSVSLLSAEIPPERYASFREAVLEIRKADASAIVLVRP